MQWSIWFRKLLGILNVLKVVSLIHDWVVRIVSSFKPLKASGTNVIWPALLTDYCDIKDTEEDDEPVRRDGKFCIVPDFRKSIRAWK